MRNVQGDTDTLTMDTVSTSVNLKVGRGSKSLPDDVSAIIHRPLRQKAYNSEAIKTQTQIVHQVTGDMTMESMRS